MVCKVTQNLSSSKNTGRLPETALEGPMPGIVFGNKLQPAASAD